MQLFAWNLDTQQNVLLRPWMKYCPWICTKRTTEDQWEQCLQYSLTEAQYALVLEGRKRAAKA